ncbi:probable methyltransferase-like protein 23 [Impatiens glandulifera]|uniref:probable methyltransferase-like protein 23 n=1 Tax=Impatiens glandulifera TaxID=253017 RepID=UPI001FB0C963|nr:probable methyltransferase-like protein 23 [Impatiens glandulifera]
MTTTSLYYFGQTDDAYSVTIFESMEEEYGLFVWPCSIVTLHIVLAEYVWQQRSRFSGANVVELGAGTSLPGLVAAKVGSIVTLTDASDKLEVLENMMKVSYINKLNCKVMGLTWGSWDEEIFSLKPKIILRADVLYDNNLSRKLVHILSGLLFMFSWLIFRNLSTSIIMERIPSRWTHKKQHIVNDFRSVAGGDDDLDREDEEDDDGSSR